MQWDRHLVDLGAELAERRGALADQLVDVRLRVRMAKAFLHDGDLHASHVPGQGVRVGRRLHVDLARIEPVGPGQHLEQHRVVGDRRRHRPRVIEGVLDGKHARVRHEAVRGLHAVDPAVGGRDPDRSALIATDGHVDVAGGHGRRATR